MAEQTTDGFEQEHTETFCHVCVKEGLFVEAAFVCVVCVGFLCNDCENVHTNNPILKTHYVLRQDEFDIAPEILDKLHEILHCEEHEIEPKYICRDHTKLICNVCIKTSHRRCKEIEEADLSMKSAMKDVQEFEQKVKELVQRKEVAFQEHKKYRETVTTKDLIIQNKLKIFMESLVENISSSEKEDGSCLSTLSELSDNLLSYQRLLQAVPKLNDTEKEKTVANFVQVSLQKSEATLESVNSESNHRSKTQGLIQRIETLLKAIPPITSHDVHEESNLDIVSDLDVSSGDLNDARWSIDSVPGKRQGFLDNSSMSTINVKDSTTQTSITDYRKSVLPLSERSLQFSGAYNIGVDEEMVCEVTGIVVLTDGRTVITDLSFCGIKVFDEQFYFQMHHKTSSTPISICCIPGHERTVAVLDSSNRVHIYVIRSKFVMHLRGFDIGSHCRGICGTDTDEIAVLLAFASVPKIRSGRNKYVVTDRNVVEVQFRSTEDGTIRKSIRKFSNNFEGPVFSLQVLDSRILLGEKNRLTIWDYDGVCYRSYIGNHANDLAGIQGQTIDSEGNIYVCGQGSSNVHQVSRSDASCNRVIIPQVLYPRSVAFDPYNERLLIGCDGCKWLYVYNYI